MQIYTIEKCTYALCICPIEIQMYTIEKCTYALHICPVEIQMYIIGWYFPFHNPRKYPFLKGKFIFHLRDIFQEYNCGVKWDLCPYFSFGLWGFWGGPGCAHD
jgi:hypothetical protein